VTRTVVKAVAAVTVVLRQQNPKRRERSI
jgi:hypothetical protein